MYILIDMKMKKWYYILLFLLLTSCRQEVEIFTPEKEEIGTPEFSSICGFYLLNEGNMGTNKSTLDYYDYQTGIYTRNIYGNANPNVPKEMGDVGNDLKIYKNRLYAVINCSNKIEVMDAKMAKRIGQINIPNCRYIAFHDNYAYVTSYAGPVEINPEYKQRGYVAKIDIESLQITDTCFVGFQPDELAIAEGKIYVANSGGYMYPNYENTISVIDLERFEEIKRIEVDINLHRVRNDQYGQLWVSSRGDYYDHPSRLYCIDTKKDIVIDTISVGCSNMCIVRDSLYFYCTEWSNIEMSNKITYGIVHTKDRRIVSRQLISDGTEKDIQIPYGIIINPLNNDIYITDAKNYVTPGRLYCFDANGKKKWEVRTGDIPAHFAFVGTYGKE